MHIYSEAIEPLHTLALGIEPLDVMCGRRLIRPIHVDIEAEPPGPLRGPRDSYRRPSWPHAPRPVATRHDSGVHVILAHHALPAGVDLRFYEHERVYVPRRIRVPLAHYREIRPTLFPGAAYPLASRATGLRGRVVRTVLDGTPVAWARVVASINDQDIAYAHGDDRGEFLLILPPRAMSGSEITASIDVDRV